MVIFSAHLSRYSMMSTGRQLLCDGNIWSLVFCLTLLYYVISMIILLYYNTLPIHIHMCCLI